ncbi:DUF6402 family protein [Helicobacter trogontum]|uniref:DUF6402 family protein n=1 Tax=Helicobacter trogontum TaxID=50960 RepID=UPI00068FC591|nr:DUF6402 family protein [Helicobacter trogontum]
MDYIYCHSISDIDFGLEYKLSFEEKSNQAIALYVLSGKFQIYYVLDSFETERMNESTIVIYPTQIKAYIDDSFDFRDQSMQFVGAWDYENVGFDLFYSVIQYRQSRIRDKFPDMLTTIFGTKSTSPTPFLFFLYNSDFLRAKQHFNLGLDFFLYSSTFLDITSKE